jgi:hypothetical protein
VTTERIGPVGPYPTETTWTFNGRRSAEVKRTSVHLSYGWNVACTTFSDDHDPAETSAHHLWTVYFKRFPKLVNGEDGLPPGVVPIDWTVEDIAEHPPFLGHSESEGGTGDFLDYYTVPYNDATGERINWLRLPVRDYFWTPERNDSAGWFQQVTGWQPSPLQQTVDLRLLAKAAGLPYPTPAD